MDWDLIAEIAGFVIGVIYLWWEYHANRLMWLASVIMPAVSLYVYYSRGLYADFGINIYYLIIAVYGFLHWSRGGDAHDSKTKSKKQRDVTHAPRRAWVIVPLMTGVLWVALWWILTRFTNSTVPIPDAFTTALSIVAMWMLARKWAEQWLAWLVVDAVCVGLYIYKGIYLYAGLYAIYTVIAVMGYAKWCRMANGHQNSVS